MKIQKLSAVSLAFIIAVSFAIRSVSVAVQSSPHKTGAKEVKEKTADAIQAIEKFSIDQRDEAVKKAKAALDDLDARIDGMESQLNKKWDRMDQSARTKATAALQKLQKKRNEAAEWYGGLKHGSGEAWEDVKKGFVKSYRDLRGAFEKARGEL